MSQLTAYFQEFQHMYFNKKTFLLPYYLSKRLGIDFYFYYGHNVGNISIPKLYRGVHMCDYKRKKTTRINMFYDRIRTVLFNAKKTRCLFFIHITTDAMISTFIYKMLNKSGRVVVRADIEGGLATELTKHDFVFTNGIVGFLKRLLVNFFFENAIVAVGNDDAYEPFSDMYKRHGWKNLVQVYPALDIEEFRKLGLKYRNFEDKEKIFLYVGRIGNYQKNTDMMLDALEKVDFKDWKFYLVGPITSSFDTREKSNYDGRIKQLFERRPDLINKVIFTGPEYDFKTLYEYYLKAKVFVLSSRHESLANVLSEAAALGCYIVSTDVGSASKVSNNWQFGTRINQDDADNLASVLTQIVNGDLNMDPSKAINRELLTWDYMITRVINLMKD